MNDDIKSKLKLILLTHSKINDFIKENKLDRYFSVENKCIITSILKYKSRGFPSYCDVISYVYAENANSADFSNDWGFYDTNFQDYSFTDCKWTNKVFNGNHFGRVNFIDCEFFNCTFTNVSFNDCIFVNVKIIESTLLNCKVTYISIKEQCEVKIEKSKLYKNNIHFENSELKIANSILEDNTLTLRNKKTKLLIEYSFLTNNTFLCCYLENSIIQKSEFEINYFLFSNLNNEFIDVFQNIINIKQFVDLYTIASSKVLTKETLSYLFDINTTDLQFQIKKSYMTTRYLSIFISYSSKDRNIAEDIFNNLKKFEVNVFLWHKENRIGFLKDIMLENVEKYDRLLFLCSENSLKSEAVHFELTKIRIDYNTTWKTRLIPIRVDDFIFNINEFQIPLKNREQFWQNILFLREQNILNLKSINEEGFKPLLQAIKYNTIETDGPFGLE